MLQGRARLYQHRVASGIQDKPDTLQTSVSAEGWAEYPGRKADEVILWYKHEGY